VLRYQKSSSNAARSIVAHLPPGAHIDLPVYAYQKRACERTCTNARAVAQLRRARALLSCASSHTQSRELLGAQRRAVSAGFSPACHTEDRRVTTNSHSATHARDGTPRSICTHRNQTVGRHALDMFGASEAPPRRRRDSPIRVLFVPREQHITNRTRKIRNWDAVVRIIVDEAMRVGAELTLLHFGGNSHLPLSGQLAALHNADIVITQRGSTNANFLVLRHNTRVLLLADPIDYEPFHWIGPMWYKTRIVHIAGGNSDPFGLVDASALQRALAAMLADLRTRGDAIAAGVGGSHLHTLS